MVTGQERPTATRVSQPRASQLLNPKGSPTLLPHAPLCVLTHSESHQVTMTGTSDCTLQVGTELRTEATRAAGLKHSCCDCGRLNARHPAITHGSREMVHPASPEYGPQVDSGES